MFRKLDEVERRFEDLERKLQDPSISPAEIRQFTKEHSDLSALVNSYREFKQLERDLAASKEMLQDKDADMRAFAREETARVELRRGELIKELNLLLLPKDPNDDRNVILEIRAGAGGDEAGLFAGEMLRSYQKRPETLARLLRGPSPSPRPQQKTRHPRTAESSPVWPGRKTGNLWA